MTFVTVLLIVIVILAVVGLGWSQFSIGVVTGLNKALDIGIPIIKNLTTEAMIMSTTGETITII
jgi:hypothetical protein